MKLLGIDVGTSGTRAVVIDETGAVIASETAEHTPFASLEPAWAEQNPEDWWRAATAAIRGVLQTIKPEKIRAIGLSGQMHGAVLLDADDAVLRPALLWCDQRTARQCEEITNLVGAKKLIELVSNPAVTGFTLPKLLWVRENEPEIWARTKTVLLPKDYVRFRLSGEKASDVADASGTLLFDVRNRRWSKEMLEAFEIDERLLPPVFESIERTGAISAAGAAETGLKIGTPIVAGAGDNAAGAIGMGITSAGATSATIGTSGVVFAATDQPFLDPNGRIHTLCHAIPGRWHNTGVTLAAGLSLRWLRDNFGDDGATYEELIKEAARIPPGSEGAIWLPYLMGERTPHFDPNARAALVGLTASHTRAHATRAVLEGVAFSLRDSFEIFRDLGVSVHTVRLGGGGARSALWRQIQADVYNAPVETIQADEGAAFGAALLAGVGAGFWASVDEACTATVKTSERIEPDARNVAEMNRVYQIYRGIYPALRGVL